MFAFGSNTCPISDTGTSPAIKESNRRGQPRPRGSTPTARIDKRLCPWYYRSPMLDTVYMKPIYTHCDLEGVLTPTPRFCAAELNFNTSNQTFSLLPIPADKSNATFEYCKIKYWESHLYNTKQSGIGWEQLNEGVSIRYRTPKKNPLTRRPATTCPAPYLIVLGKIGFSYRRHPSLYQHVPGEFHGYGNFDRSFTLDRSPRRYYSVGKTDTSVALAVVLISLLLIMMYLRRHTRTCLDVFKKPRLFDSGVARS